MKIKNFPQLMLKCQNFALITNAVIYWFVKFFWWSFQIPLPIISLRFRQGVARIVKVNIVLNEGKLTYQN